MSQRSEIYRNFREQLKTVGDLAGQQSTNELLKGVDQLWRSLVRVRSAMVKTLMNQNKIQHHSEVPSEDFSTLFLQIHNPKRDARLCEHCCGLVEFGIISCPYCGEQVNGQNSNQFINSISIDIKVNPKAPNWNIDYASKGILDEAKKKEIATIPTITPKGRSLDDLNGPKGTDPNDKRRHNGKLKLSRSTADLLRWARLREYAAKFPYSADTLTKLRRGDLHLILNFLKARTPDEVIRLSHADTVSLILGHQPQSPVDIGAPPIGELPELDEDSDENVR